MTAALLLAIPVIVVFGLWGGTGEPDGLLGEDVVATAFAGGEAGQARRPAEASARLTQPRVASPGDSDPSPAPAAVPGAAGPGTPAERPPAPAVATAGRLVVESEPAGANVTVNGIGWGVTPVTIRYVPFGEKRVRVTMAGYRSQERIVRLGSTQASATVRITLRAAE